MRYVKAPDFPTGGELLDLRGLESAYATGRGSVTLRAKIELETAKTGRSRASSTRESLIITEIPYQAVKARIAKDIADLVEAKRMDGIADIRDESDRTGMRLVLDLKKGADPSLVQNRLLRLTSLQKKINFNMVAVVEGVPRQVGLKQVRWRWWW